MIDPFRWIKNSVFLTLFRKKYIEKERQKCEQLLFLVNIG